MTTTQSCAVKIRALSIAALAPGARAALPRPCQIQRRTIRSISKPAPKPSRYNQTASRPPLGSSQLAASQRKIASDTLAVRTGALATKKGMTAVFDPVTGKRTPCTLLQLDRVQVVAHKTRRKHGYDAVVVGTGWQAPRRLPKAMLGVYAHATYVDENGGVRGIAPKNATREFLVRNERDPMGRQKLPVGTEIKPDWWNVGDFVDVKGITKGKGFAGVMKRWGMGGQPASHGVSLTHRSLGSAGGSQGSGSRVHPGKRMAGNMGNYNHTIQNLKVMSVDVENGIIVVSGSVPGPNKAMVKIVDSVKKPWPTISNFEKQAFSRVQDLRSRIATARSADKVPIELLSTSDSAADPAVPA